MSSPTLQEIRDKCQQVHKGDITMDVIRIFSVYFTWLGVRLKISANQVSIANMFVSILIAISFSWGYPYGYLTALFFLVLSPILDGVDGELARYWEKSSLTGLFLDRINSIFFYSLPFIGIAIGKIHDFDDILILYLSFIAAWSMLSIRLAKTYIDACVIDALTSYKAKIEDDSKFNLDNFNSASNAIRENDGIHWWLADFFLVRALGFVFTFLLATILELAFPSFYFDLFGIQVTPLLIVVMLYAVTGTAALLYGIIGFAKNSTAEKNFYVLRRKFIGGYAGE